MLLLLCGSKFKSHILNIFNIKFYKLSSLDLYIKYFIHLSLDLYIRYFIHLYIYIDRYISDTYTC